MPKVKIIKGDTLTQVSVKKNVSLNALKSLNPGVKTVKAGQVIRVPKPDRPDRPQLQSLLSGGVNPASVNLPNIIPNFNQPFQQFQQPFQGQTQQPGVISNPLVGTSAVMPRVNPNPIRGNIQSGGMLSPDKIVPAYGQHQTVIPKPAASAYTGTAGYWGAYNQPNVQSGGMLSPDKNPVVRQPYLGAAGYLNPVYQTPQNTQPTNVPTASTVKLTSPRPTGVFTGDPNDPNTAAWRAYWNNVAQLGGDPNIPAAAPTVMTREEIWQMKAASRRRKMSGMSADELAPSGGYSGGYEPFQYTENQQFSNEPLVRSITWGI